MKKLGLGIFLIAGILFFIYLILPSPPPPPSLPDSVKSTEPGDTIQVPRVSAYYSQHPRSFVTKYYQDQFSKTRPLGIKIPSYRLNHPPEYSRDKIRDQLQSSYFEEIVYPFRGSLFINGWEPEVYFAGNKSNIDRYSNTFEDKNYFSKVTLRPFYTNLIVRMLNYFAILITLIILYSLTQKIVIFKNK